MIQAISDALQYDFMRNALTAGILVSVACGIIGTYVILNRIVFISGGIAHAAYGGIGLGYYFGFDPIIGAVVFSLFSSLGMGLVQRKTRQRSDTIIGVMWAVGMALGIILIDLAKGYKADLMSYLFGSILAVPKSDIFMMVVLLVLILVFVTAFYRELLALSFDETFTTIRNVRVDLLYYLMLIFIGLTVVMMMRVVGLIMVIALLTIPAGISSLLFKDVKKIMAYAVLFGIFFTIIGLSLSYFLNLTSGATIILVGGFTYLVVLAWKSINENSRKKMTMG